MIDRKRVFDAIRRRLGRISEDQVQIGDLLLDAFDSIAPDATERIVAVVQSSALDLACEMIRRWEGFSSTAYRDVGGVETIGYGFTDGELVARGQMTRDEAEFLLREKVADYMRRVQALVHVSLSDRQVAALTSFAYNVGLGAFARSTLLKKLNAGDVRGAADEFLRWTRVGNRTVRGLVARRRAERDLFLGGA
jgi:lysozyme